MEKIGLVPLLYDELNYGGILQFYALQKVINKMGYEVEILKYSDGRLVCKENQNNFLKSVLIQIYRIINYPLDKRKEKRLYKNIENRISNTTNFKNKFYFKTVCIEKPEQFSNYKGVICGSDQIWNPAWVKERTLLFSVPENVNKIIYAASLGCESISEKNENILKPYIERINHISVREYSGKKILDHFITDKDIEVVLDPTLLLTKQEWSNLLGDPKYDNYVFTYFLGDSFTYINKIKEFANKNNLKIINIKYASCEKIDENNFGDINIDDANPQDFLTLINNAKYIFTDSFHACVFSVIFNKQFKVFKRKGSTNMIGRIMTLIENFNLENVILNEDDDICFTKNQNEEAIFKKQKELVKKSISFLERSINNE